MYRNSSNKKHIIRNIHATLPHHPQSAIADSTQTLIYKCLCSHVHVSLFLHPRAHSFSILTQIVLFLVEFSHTNKIFAFSTIRILIAVCCFSHYACLSINLTTTTTTRNKHPRTPRSTNTHWHFQQQQRRRLHFASISRLSFASSTG